MHDELRLHAVKVCACVLHNTVIPLLARLVRIFYGDYGMPCNPRRQRNVRQLLHDRIGGRHAVKACDGRPVAEQVLHIVL